jgi:hypothetical protein
LHRKVSKSFADYGRSPDAVEERWRTDGQTSVVTQKFC